MRMLMFRQRYNKVLSEIFDVYAPIRERLVSTKQTVPWYTLRLCEARRKHGQCVRKWCATGLVVHREMYKEQRLIVRTLVESEKSKYFTNKIREC